MAIKVRVNHGIEDEEVLDISAKVDGDFEVRVNGVLVFCIFTSV
jgi:hypothetical protein